MKWTIAVFLLLVAAQSFAASRKELECRAGQCEDWAAEYKGSFSDGWPVTVLLKNKSGKSAFNVKVILNCYDYFDDFLGRVEFKVEGPIHEKYWHQIYPPSGAESADFEIYWIDKYQG